MYSSQAFLKNLDSVFIDNQLRRENKSYVVDTSSLLDFRENSKNFINNLFLNYRITIYLPVIRELVGFLEYKLYYNSSKHSEKLYRDFLKLLNRKNVRVVNYQLKDEEMLNLIKKVGLKEDPELTFSTLNKNLEKNDVQILLATIYEGNYLVTADERMKEIARYYHVLASFPGKLEREGRAQGIYPISLKRMNKMLP